MPTEKTKEQKIEEARQSIKDARQTKRRSRKNLPKGVARSQAKTKVKLARKKIKRAREDEKRSKRSDALIKTDRHGQIKKKKKITAKRSERIKERLEKRGATTVERKDEIKGRRRLVGDRENRSRILKEDADAYRKKSVTTKVKKNPKKRVTVVQDKGEGSYSEDKRQAYLKAQREALKKRTQTRQQSRAPGRISRPQSHRTSKPLHETE